RHASRVKKPSPRSGMRTPSMIRPRLARPVEMLVPSPTTPSSTQPPSAITDARTNNRRTRRVCTEPAQTRSRWAARPPRVFAPASKAPSRLASVEVEHEPIRIAEVASGKLRVLLDDGAPRGDEVVPRRGDVLHLHLEHRRVRRRASLDEQLERPGLEADEA